MGGNDNECADKPVTTGAGGEERKSSLKLLFAEYFVIVGSALVKIPQVIKLYKEQNMSGLSLKMVLMETGCQMINSIYFMSKGESFNVYGENLCLAAGNLAILHLCSGFLNKRPLFHLATLLAAACLRFLLKLNTYAPRLLPLLSSCTIVVYMASRLPQILLNRSSQSTGVLSVHSFAGNLIGSLIRILSAHHQKDALMMVNMLVSVALNSTLVGQILYYGDKSKP